MTGTVLALRRAPLPLFVEVFDKWLGGLSGAVSEQPLDAFFDFLVASFSGNARNNDAITIEKGGSRDRFAHVESRQVITVGAGPDRKRDLVAGQKIRDAWL